MAKNPSVSILTRYHDDLFRISRILMRGLDPALLTDPQNPILISVDGSTDSGKKIMPDAAYPVLLGRNFIDTGTIDYDEYCFSGSKRRKVEVDFLNAAWEVGPTDPSRYHLPSLNGYNVPRMQKIQDFLAQRQHGGVSFIHNSPQFAKKHAWLNIWIESGDSLPTTISKVERAPQALKDKFNQLRDDYNGWVRYVRITVKDDRLIQSPRFMAAIDSLRPAEPREPAVFRVNVPKP